MSRKPIPKAIREQVKARFDGRCGYCGCTPDKLVIDHIVPVIEEHWQNVQGDKNLDPNRISNLMPACHQCNNYKLSFSIEQFRFMIQGQVNAARKYSVNFRFAEKYGLVKVIEKPIKFYFEHTSNIDYYDEVK